MARLKQTIVGVNMPSIDDKIRSTNAEYVSDFDPST